MLEMLRFFMSMTGMAIPLGLLLMMAGRVRYRNELDTLVRVTSAFGITIAFYWLTGYSLSTSPSFLGLFGTGNWAFGRDEMLGGDATNLQTIFLFAVPSIVVATSLSERGTWLTSNILVIAVAGLIVPIAAHWAWASDSYSAGWLVSLGFKDMGGAVVFFATAGFGGLAATMVIGHRMSRFPDKEDRPRGHSPTFTFFGAMVLTIGLALMTAGRAEMIDQMSGIFLNVVIGSTFAGAGALAFMVVRPSKVSAFDLMNASLAGGIALIAFATNTAPASAALVGMFAGAVAIGLRNVLDILEIDDPGDLISITLAGGVVGGAIAPLMVPSESGTLLQSVGVQVLGIAAIGVWTYISVWLVATLLHKTLGLRVDQSSEMRGLSLSHFNLQSEPDFLITHLSGANASDTQGHSDRTQERTRLSSLFSDHVVALRNESRRAISRIQSTSPDAKVGSAMAARMRLSDDGLRVKSEDVLLLIEHIMDAEERRKVDGPMMEWTIKAMELLMEPCLNDLTQFTRHLPLQADLEELESMVIGSTESVARCAHQLEMIQDLCDAQGESFFTQQHTCDLAQLFTKQTTRLQVLSDVRNSPLQIDCPIGQGLYVVGDANAFARILVLIVEGAFNRSVSRSSHPVRLELREHSSGNHVILECLDTGTALSARQLRALSNPTESSDTLADLGLMQILPLMLATRLIEAMGGEFTLSSEQGLGTLLHCRFRKLNAHKGAV